MKVFAFIKQSSAAKFIITDIVEAFNRTGAEILFIDFDLFVKQNKNIRLKEKYDKIAEMIVRIKEFNPDMIICYGLEIFTCIFEDMDSNLKISLFDYFKIKPVCCFLFDFGEPFNDKSEEIVCLEKFQSHNVIYFVWDKEAIRIMNKCGIVNVFYFPMAVNEKYFFEDHSIQRNKSICFIGGPTKERIQTLESIVQYSPEIFGYGKEEWIKSVPLKEYYKYPVYTREELRTIYSQYLFSINITRPHGFSSLNMRVYESIICGAVMITDDKTDVYDLFAPDEEILVYKNIKELNKIISNYLNDKTSLDKIRNNGMNKILKSHTYLKRISSISHYASAIIFETELFNALFDFYNDKNFKAIFESIKTIDESSIKINKIYYYLFKTLAEKNKIDNNEKTIETYVRKAYAISLKNKKFNKAIA